MFTAGNSHCFTFQCLRRGAPTASPRQGYYFSSEEFLKKKLEGGSNLKAAHPLRNRSLVSPIFQNVLFTTPYVKPGSQECKGLRRRRRPREGGRGSSILFERLQGGEHNAAIKSTSTTAHERAPLPSSESLKDIIGERKERERIFHKDCAQRVKSTAYISC